MRVKMIENIYNLMTFITIMHENVYKNIKNDIMCRPCGGCGWIDAHSIRVQYAVVVAGCLAPFRAAAVCVV